MESGSQEFRVEVVEAYYNQAKDKAQAVTDILSVTDYAAFLEKSGYAEQFARQK